MTRSRRPDPLASELRHNDGIDTPGLMESTVSPVVTVAKLLELPTLSSSTVIAGVRGLERPVWNVGVVAGTEVTEWVKPGSMLLSTGHPLEERHAALPQIVADLAERNVSCLAVRLGNYGFEFSEELRTAADHVGLPLIRLTDNYAFDDILIDVLSKINLALRSEVDFVERVHASTTDVVMNGGTLEALMLNLSRLLSAHVGAFDPTGESLATGGADSAPASTWESLEEAAHEVGSLKEPAHRVVIRLGSDRIPLGFLECRRPSAAFGPTEIRAVEKSATVVALALAQRSAVRAVETHYQAETLTRVLYGELTDLEGLSQRLADIGWTLTSPFVVGMVRLATPGKPRNSDALAWLRSFALPIARTHLSPERGAGIAAIIGADLVMITAWSERTRMAGAFQRISHVFARGCLTRSGAKIAMGLSGQVDDLRHLSRGYQQAVVAAKAGHYQVADGHLTDFQDLGVLGVVLAAKNADLHAAQPDPLTALDVLPARERAELLTTLRVTLDNNLNLAEAARVLHCHYNTLRRRVKRLEGLLGPFTDHADTRLMISLQLRLRDHRDGYVPPSDSGPGDPGACG